eukprot:127202-Prymnesium_polylepis.3
MSSGAGWVVCKMQISTDPQMRFQISDVRLLAATLEATIWLSFGYRFQNAVFRKEAQRACKGA